MDFDSYARRLWAGRADAYEHGFARLTVHAVGALLDDATIERIKGEFGSLAARYATGDGAVALPASAVLASGTRP